MEIELELAQTLTVDFLNTQPATISGHKWNDLNGDGVWDGGEPALEGWTIELRKDGVIIYTDVTDGDGYYEFPDLQPGTYTLTEVLLDGWTNTYSPPAVTVAPGDDSTDNDFGNFELIDKSGHKYEDEDGDMSFQ